MECLAAPSRLGLRPAARQSYCVRLPPWRLGVSSYCRFHSLVSRQLAICHADLSNADDLGVAAPDGLAYLRSRLLVQSVLALFLRLKGLRAVQAKKITIKSYGFIDHLFLRLLDTYGSRYDEGGELNATEIKDALLPYLEDFAREHGDGWVKLVENFQDPSSVTSSNEQNRTPILDDALPECVPFLLELGMDYKVISRDPLLFEYSRNKVETTVNFLTELGVSKENIVKILTRYPKLIGYSVDDKLRPAAEYFTSVGADVASLIQLCPHVFRYNVEAKLKPITVFFLERGFSIEEIGIMAKKLFDFYGFSLERKLRPKYEFFLTMGYPRDELLKFPRYFTLSLERRIKPRYIQMANCGLRLPLSTLLLKSDLELENTLKRRMTDADLRRQ